MNEIKKKILVALVLFGLLTLSSRGYTQAINPNNLPLCPAGLQVNWNNCYGTYIHQGNQYSGEWRYGIMDGYGIFTYSTGVKYFGDIKKGKYDGSGEYQTKDGVHYKGEFRDGKFHGKGRHSDGKGNVYEGDWVNGVIEGYGAYVFSDKSKYVGDWRGGKSDGFGTHTAISGSQYIGQFRNGAYQGYGTLISSDGSRFEGLFENGILVQEINDSSRQNKKDSSIFHSFVIKPDFLWVGDFKEGPAPVKMSDTGKYGFVDKQGKMVIAPNFDYAYSFQEELAAVQIGDKKTGEWGFIDKQGKMIIKPQFKSASSFKEGLAAVFNGDKYGYIDKQGKININPVFESAMDFSEGLAAVQIGDFINGKWGFIDKKGKMVIKPNFYAYLSRFSEGLAAVRTGDDETGKWGYIDKQGKIKIFPEFTSASSFSDGLAVVGVQDGAVEKKGYIDKQGKMIIKPQFEFAQTFSEGLAAVLIGDKYGYIDKYGKTIVYPQFDEAMRFSEGLAAVRIGDKKTGKWGFINKNGVFEIDANYDNSMDLSGDFFILSNAFYDGLASSCIKENLIRKCGFISKNQGQQKKQITLQNEQQKQQQQQDEKKQQSPKLILQTVTTIPNADGVVHITIRTNTDISSLKINGEEQGGRPDGNYVIKKVARVGQDTNYIITAIDSNGNTDSTTITVVRQAVSKYNNQSASLKPENIKRAPARDAVAIIIGIQNYKRVPKADFANNDAKEFYEYAIRGLGIKPENIKLLLDEEADEIEIVKAFQNWLPLQVTKNKTDVYVFYSGHGLPSEDGQSLYFLPYGVDKQFLSRTAVGQKEVVSALLSSKPKTVTMFIDACYSGQTRSGEILLASAKPIALKTDTYAFPPNFTVISASANDQISSSSPELKHGIFSFYLMKGMEGDADLNKDGKITAGEMQDYLSDKVARQAMSMSRKQDTQLVGDSNRVLIGTR